MRSITQYILLFIYFLLVFVISRMLDLVIWYQHGISPTQTVEPLMLSVRQLKHLLQNRGVSYSGFVEKHEFAELVDASADLQQGEVDELDSETVSPADSHFTARSHFFEEVEDNIWLVQVIPLKPSAKVYDKTWSSLCNLVAPFEIRTGIFDCKHHENLCNSNEWTQPMLLLVLPKGSGGRDEPVVKTCTLTKTQLIINWLHKELAVFVKSVGSIGDVEKYWLQQDSSNDNSTTVSTYNDVKVLLLTHLFSPPLFLAALSIKFTGRITFGIFSVKKEESETVRKRLKLLDHRIPTYYIITPEGNVAYGFRRFEHFNFRSMNQFLRAVHPEMNDVFLCTLVLVNMLVSLQIFQVSVRLWWKHIALCLWTVVKYNFWLFSAWLLILATYRLSFMTLLADKCLVFIRYASLTEAGAIFRGAWLNLSQHPYLLFFTFFLYGWGTTWLLKRYYTTELQNDGGIERPWWEVLPVNSQWINCFFRPMSNLPRPLLTSEVELEEGIDMLIERLAVPNLWLQPVIATEYIKNLPVWKHRGWDLSVPRAEAKRAVKQLLTEQELIEQSMDGEDPIAVMCQRCNEERKINPHAKSSPNYRKEVGFQPSLGDNTSVQSTSRSVSGEDLSMADELTSRSNKETNVSSKANWLCSSCKPWRSAKFQGISISCDIYKENISSTAGKDSVSEESGDDCSIIPHGMRQTSDCAVCLESYSWGTLLCGLPCGHSYHQNCIKAWLHRDNHHCPVCRWPAYKNKHMPSHLHCE